MRSKVIERMFLEFFFKKEVIQMKLVKPSYVEFLFWQERKNLESKFLIVFEKDKKNMVFWPLFFNKENQWKMTIFQFLNYDAELGLTWNLVVL